MSTSFANPPPPPKGPLPAGGNPRLLHVIPSLEVGGAETMLLRLLEHEAASGFEHEVLTLLEGGALAARFRAAGVEVHSLGMRRGLPTPGAALRLRRTVRQRAPQLLVGWLYHGNLAASFGARACRPRPPVVWNIRHSPDDLAAERRLTALLIRAGARLSRGAAAVVYNSHTSERLHRELGYAAQHAEVLPNGFDTRRFSPREGARERLHQRLGLAAQSGGAKPQLVGRIGRYHSMKGFELFLEAAAGLARRRPGLHLLLAGRGVTPENPSLRAAVEAHALVGRAHLLGPQEGLEELLPGLDVFCSSSLFGEGFPNIVAEAMACGVPAVVTDVGDSAHVVGQTGRVVPPGDGAALARALGSILDLPGAQRQEQGAAARRRVVECFSADRVFPRYTETWSRAITAARDRGAA